MIKGAIKCAVTVLVMCIPVMVRASFVAIPGENIWSLTDQVGYAFNPLASETDLVLSLSDIWGTRIEFIGSVMDSVESTVNGFESRVESLAESLCSSIESIQSGIGLWASELDLIDENILSISNVLQTALAESETLLDSVVDLITTQIDVAGSVLDSKLDDLETCLHGIMVRQTDFNSGTFTIRDAGLYILCEDITFVGATAVSIAADDVVFDLNGHTINFNGTTIFDIEFHNNITVKNGTLAMLASAQSDFFVNQASQVFIQGITANAVTFTLQNSNTVSLSDCSIAGTTTVGASVVAVTSFYMTRSAVFNNTTGGIQMTNSDFVIELSIFHDNSGFGIYFFENDSGVVRDCYAYNEEYGFLTFSSGPIYFGYVNVINCLIGLDTQEAITLVADSTFSDCNTGIFIDSSDGVVVKRCVVADNSTGIFIDNASSNTQILDSCVVDNGTNFVDNGTNTTVIDLGTVFEILCSKIESLDGSITSQLESTESILDSFLDIATSVFDNIGATIECVLGTPIRQENLPYSINAEGLYTVCEPLTLNGEPVIMINASNVILDLGQYTITTNNQAIVSTGVNNVVIRNGVLRAAQQAISCTNNSGVTLQGLNIYNPADVGVSFTNVSDFVIDSCKIQGTSGFVTGSANPGAFYFSACMSGSIINCGVFGTDAMPQRGFVFTGTPTGASCTVVGSTAQNVVHDGFLNIDVGGGSGNGQGLSFDSCCAIQAAQGFTTTNTTVDLGPTFTHCVALNCGYGFSVTATEGALFQNCIAFQNMNSGYVCDSTSTNTAFVSCIGNYNKVGFDLAGVDSTGTRCTAIGNVFQGVKLYATSGDTVIQGMLLGRNGTAGFTDGGATTPAVVDVRSQDPANTVTPNPAFILNGAADNKSSSVVIRTS